MFNNPQINCPAFQSLKLECNKRHLSLWLAKNENSYLEKGGNYAVYSRFANMQLVAGESLQDIADFLKIGGVYD